MSKKIPISCSTNVQKQKFNTHHYKLFVYKMAMGLLFTNLKKKIIILKEVKKIKMLFCVELALDQLYQLMVLETPFDHFF